MEKALILLCSTLSEFKTLKGLTPQINTSKK